jgi:hypothetical protein
MMGFEDYKAESNRATKGCPVEGCGEKIVGRVAIGIHEKIEDSAGSRTDPYRQLKSRSRSMCEKHTVEAYERAVATLP